MITTPRRTRHQKTETGRPPNLDQLKLSGIASGLPLALGSSIAVAYGWVTVQDGKVCYWNGDRVVEDNFSFSDHPGRDARDRMLDLKASALARAIGADTYITEREYLLAERRWLREYGHYRSGSQEPPCYDVPAATALVGLYLRAQGAYVVDGSVLYGAFGKKCFYSRAADAVVPAAKRKGAAVLDYADRANEADLKLLVYTLVQRIEDSFAARDAVHQALNRPEEFYAINAVFAALDNCLTLLMAALDACARIVHRFLAVGGGLSPGSPRDAGWQRPGWVKGAAEGYPELAQLVQEGAEGNRTLVILTALRNTVHAESLHSRAFGQMGNFGFHPLLRLPQEERKVRDAIDSLPDAKAWGITLKCGEAHADPGVFLEQLYARTLRLLNEILTRLPMEEPPHTPLQKGREPNDTAVVEAIRWQVGLP